MNASEVISCGSKAARLADIRVRIIRDEAASDPCGMIGTVFEKAGNGAVPENALYSFRCLGTEFFTDEARCRKVISDDPADWTAEKLEKIASVEKKLYEDWAEGRVYGWVLESWNAEERMWAHEDSCWGYYGIGEILEAAGNARPPGEIPVCADACVFGDFQRAAGEKPENPPA